MDINIYRNHKIESLYAIINRSQIVPALLSIQTKHQFLGHLYEVILVLKDDFTLITEVNNGTSMVLIYYIEDIEIYLPT